MALLYSTDVFYVEANQQCVDELIRGLEISYSVVLQLKSTKEAKATGDNWKTCVILSSVLLYYEVRRCYMIFC